MLSETNHRREGFGLTYVYPVISRRSGGLSIGINLNTNNACNWRCIYCQVPGLTRGSAPEINLELLQQELSELITGFMQGANYERFNIPLDNRAIRDIAISGNGEPTSAPEFDQIIDAIGRTLRETGIPRETKLVLITNGSLIQRPAVQKGIKSLSLCNGEVWFKLDSVTNAGMRRINNANITMRTVSKNLMTCAGLCPTWIQTCVFALDGEPPSAEEQDHYLDFLATTRAEGLQLKGVLLYGIARPSLQPEASRLSRLPQAWLEQYAARISATGLDVKISM
jgi:wyosine [tRNA(Phe)-imidazoG37] synthetase (radical SAM superfamily)